MRIGDVIESSIWVNGEESPHQRALFEQDVIEALDYFCSENGFDHGLVTFTKKHPMDEDVPEVPDHIQGQKVMLLVAASTVTGKRIETSKGSFVAELEYKDLLTLRAIIRKKRNLSDADCDALIEEIGPQIVLDTLH